MVATIGEYKGNKVISLKTEGEQGYGFSFGKAKGRLILQHIKEIEAFVEEE